MDHNSASGGRAVHLAGHILSQSLDQLVLEPGNLQGRQSVGRQNKTENFPIETHVELHPMQLNAHLVQFSRYRMLSDTVMSQIFSTVRWRASKASCMAVWEKVTLSGREIDDPIRPVFSGFNRPFSESGFGFNCLFVDASIFWGILELLSPSIAKNKKEPARGTG